MGEASAADLVRMRNEASRDPSLMENSSGIDRPSNPNDEYVTIGSVTGGRGPSVRAQQKHCTCLCCNRMALSSGIMGHYATCKVQYDTPEKCQL